jgi:hypothetical protein
MRPLWIAAALLALFGAGFAAAKAQETLGSPYGDLKIVTLQGKIISLCDELTRKYGARPVTIAEKPVALALPEGQLYTFLPTETYVKLLDAKLTGQPVEIKARQFPRSQILEVLEFKTIPAEKIARRFYCSVCAIYANDWGPCVCCGKEFTVVKP